MRCAKHHIVWIVGAPMLLFRQCCSTSILRCVDKPLNLQTMLADPSVATDTNLSRLAFLSMSFSKIKRANSFPVEATQERMKRGISNVLLSNENLTMQEMKCWFPKSAVSKAIEKMRYFHVFFLHKKYLFSRGPLQFRKVTVPQLLVSILSSLFGSRSFSIFAPQP